MTEDRRVVTFLGTGLYQPVVYRDPADGRRAAATPWIARALAELYDVRDIVVLATPTARNKHGDALLSDLRDAGVSAELRPIAEGGAPADLWQQFETIKTALRASDCEVILDITHGFRSQPFFAAAVVAFVRAVDPAPRQPRLRVVYGGFEARDAANVAPVWDLTPFVELLDSAREIMLFLKTGRSADVAARARDLGRQLRKTWSLSDPAHRGPAPELGRLADALAAFGSDLETVRTGALLLGDKNKPGSAARLAQAVKDTRHSLALQMPPLADVLDGIEAMATPLASCRDRLNSAEGHSAVAALACLYRDMGRYSEAATTVREGLVTLYAEDAAACPGAPRFDMTVRQEAERMWQSRDRDLGRNVAAPRNDIDHGGFRKRPLPAVKLVEQIDGLVRAFPSATPRPALGCAPVFVNISNHPSSAWDEAQRAAALALAPSILDVPFPPVPPDAGADRIAALADVVLEAVPEGASHAMVQGEFTLAFRLVNALHRRGTCCLAATTARKVAVDTNGDKTSQFAFVAFRPFLD